MDANIHTGLPKTQTYQSEGLREYLDLVCGMHLKAWESQYQVDREGIAYHFCSSECKQAFQLFPGKYPKLETPAQG